MRNFMGFNIRAIMFMLIKDDVLKAFAIAPSFLSKGDIMKNCPMPKKDMKGKKKPGKK